LSRFNIARTFLLDPKNGLAPLLPAGGPPRSDFLPHARLFESGPLDFVEKPPEVHGAGPHVSGWTGIRYNPSVIVVETERLTLRRLEIGDAEFMLGLLNDPSFLRFIGDKGVRTLDDAREYILNGPVASYERFGFGLYLTALKGDRAAIGICGLLKRDSLKDVDVGFAFLPQFWSKGYAFEAASAVMAYGRNVLGLTRIVAITSPDNEASIRLLEKLGMRFEAMVRLSEESPEIRLFASEVP